MFNNDWAKWRLAYEGGREFINQYLQKFKRETDEDYRIRKNVTYCPAFAAAAIDDVKNSIYQRMNEIRRIGGSTSYNQAIRGLAGGVDGNGMTLNNFIGQYVLPELLVMGKVGVYIDYNTAPYLYYYTAEQIQKWSDDNSRILLVDRVPIYKNGYITNFKETTRELWVEDFVMLRVDDNEPIKLNIKEIPFVIAQISKSLMTNIADYQVALLNLESSDLSYALKANFPFYVEGFDPQFQTADQNNEIKIGPSSGRRYPKGTDAPQFIHPSPEPLQVSMQKQEKIKNDIRFLLNLNLSSLQPTYASAESKKMDQTGLESGLSYIGLELERLESRISYFWSLYENSNPATIHYPENYSLKSESDRRESVNHYIKVLRHIPSIRAQKEILKLVVDELLQNKIDYLVLQEIKSDIDNNKFITSDMVELTKDIKENLVTRGTASKIRGYEEGESDRARIEHAERLSLIQKAQTKGFGEGLGVDKDD